MPLDGLRAVPKTRDSMRILIVDDYPGLVEVCDLALAARGFDVVGASTVGEAMTRGASERFDAVVLDVELPDGSGTDLARRLRQIPALAGAVFVGISAYQDAKIAQRFDAFLAKPFHPRRLASMLRRLLHRPAQN
jgi:DNA-binding response OmpR family regulator